MDNCKLSSSDISGILKFIVLIFLFFLEMQLQKYNIFHNKKLSEFNFISEQIRVSYLERVREPEASGWR